MRSVVALSVAVSLVAAPVFAQTPEAVSAPIEMPEPDRAESPAPAPSGPSAASAKRGEEVISPLGAVWRSTLVPGWGQRYKGEKKKGWIFTGVAAGLLGATALTYANARGFTSPFAENPGGAQGAYKNERSPDADYDALYENAVNSTVLFDAVGLATAGWWIYGISDSAFTPLEHLRIKDARVKDVFPAMINYYEGKPVATISVENRSSEPVTKVKVKFEAKEIMDVPAESVVVESIPPGLGKSIDVTAAFNKQVFEIGKQEPQAVAAKITIEYEVGSKKRDITRTATFTVYNRNAIVWDDMRKMAAFVTARDESVKGVVSYVARKDIKLPARGKLGARTVRANSFASAQAMSQAAAYFDTLGAAGITYVSDPTAPFNYFDGNAEAVDYIAYPAETLGRKTGDCDDLTALYASMLESSGIPTALVDVPGHVYLMFDSGLTPEEARLYGPADAFYVRNGTAWVPVEVTAVGKPFRDAWQLAAQQTKKWTGLDQLKLVDVLSSQGEFPPSPPTLATVDAKALGINDSTLARLIVTDAALAEKEEEGRQQRIAAIMKRLPEGAARSNEIGIVYARDGQLNEAAEKFNEAIRADNRMFKAYNNLANVYYLLQKNEHAVRAYEQALSVGGDQAPVLINLASLYYEMGDKKNAKVYFDRAARIEPVYEKEYPELASISRGDDTKVAAGRSSTGVGKAAAIGAGERDPRRSRWIP